MPPKQRVVKSGGRKAKSVNVETALAREVRPPKLWRVYVRVPLVLQGEEPALVWHVRLARNLLILIMEGPEAVPLGVMTDKKVKDQWVNTCPREKRGVSEASVKDVKAAVEAVVLFAFVQLLCDGHDILAAETLVDCVVVILKKYWTDQRDLHQVIADGFRALMYVATKNTNWTVQDPPERCLGESVIAKTIEACMASICSSCSSSMLSLTWSYAEDANVSVLLSVPWLIQSGALSCTSAGDLHNQLRSYLRTFAVGQQEVIVVHNPHSAPPALAAVDVRDDEIESQQADDPVNQKQDLEAGQGMMGLEVLGEIETASSEGTAGEAVSRRDVGDKEFEMTDEDWAYLAADESANLPLAAAEQQTEVKAGRASSEGTSYTTSEAGSSRDDGGQEIEMFGEEFDDGAPWAADAPEKAEITTDLARLGWYHWDMSSIPQMQEGFVLCINGDGDPVYHLVDSPRGFVVVSHLDAPFCNSRYYISTVALRAFTDVVVKVWVTAKEIPMLRRYRKDDIPIYFGGSGPCLLTVPSRHRSRLLLGTTSVAVIRDAASQEGDFTVVLNVGAIAGGGEPKSTTASWCDGGNVHPQLPTKPAHSNASALASANKGYVEDSLTASSISSTEGDTAKVVGKRELVQMIWTVIMQDCITLPGEAAVKTAAIAAATLAVAAVPFVLDPYMGILYPGGSILPDVLTVLKLMLDGDMCGLSLLVGSVCAFSYFFQHLSWSLILCAVFIGCLLGCVAAVLNEAAFSHTPLPGWTQGAMSPTQVEYVTMSLAQVAFVALHHCLHSRREVASPAGREMFDLQSLELGLAEVLGGTVSARNWT